MSEFYVPKPDPKLFYADTVCKRIESWIEEAQKNLKEGQSLLVEFLLTGGRSIVPSFIGFQNPNFIAVYGEDPNGNETCVLLSHTNLQVVLTTLNKPDERKPIGFQH